MTQSIIIALDINYIIAEEIVMEHLNIDKINTWQMNIDTLKTQTDEHCDIIFIATNEEK